MAYAAMKPTKPGLEEPQEQIHKIRITLSSKNVKNLEKGPYFFHIPIFSLCSFIISAYDCVYHFGFLYIVIENGLLC